jgi:hypothetical protein
MCITTQRLPICVGYTTFQKYSPGGVFWEKFLIENENGFGWAQLPPKPFLISDYDNPPKPFPNHGKQNNNKLL